jgi:hemoglobin
MSYEKFMMQGEVMTQSLFDKYGGIASIVPIVNSFYRKVLAIPDLRPYFDGVDMQKLTEHQVNFGRYCVS